MINTKDNFWGLLLIIIGTGLLIYGLSYFIIPLSSIISGLIILNQGLKFRNLPSLSLLLKYWFLKFR